MLEMENRDISSLRKITDPHLDRIAAIATPIGKGAIAIIRVSGHKLEDITQVVCPNVTQWVSHKMTYTTIVNHVGNVEIDKGCVVFFKSPNSFTGEDVLEFHVHGSPVTLQTLMATLSHLGIRLADAGEFSKRAFVNGKMDLSQSESIIDLIESENSMSHKIALDHYKGKLFTLITGMRRQLIQLLEHIEASIDFPDEVPDINFDQSSEILRGIQGEIEKIVQNKDYGRIIRSGLNVMIVGKPNVGKSSLFNRLCGEDRAIVTHIPGTTRDMLDADITLGGLSINVVDTAGYRESDDPIETMGIQKMTDRLQIVDMILWVVDGSVRFDENDQNIYKKISNFPSICMIKNKSDLKEECHIPEKIVAALPICEISTKTEQGLTSFKTYLNDTIIHDIESTNSQYLCNIRQVACAEQVKVLLDNMQQAVVDNVPVDMLSIDCREAILKLGEITGEELTEELLDGIFSRFCIGK